MPLVAQELVHGRREQAVRPRAAEDAAARVVRVRRRDAGQSRGTESTIAIVTLEKKARGGRSEEERKRRRRDGSRSRTRRSGSGDGKERPSPRPERAA